jgi:osmoprotectant transport system permease protein
VTVGSKAFTESVILGELVTQLARGAGARVTHKEALGATRVLWNGLQQGSLDVYPEYTGTISQEILAGQGVHDEKAIRAALAERGIRMSRPLGFNNTYAVGMKEDLAAKLGIQKVSDLRAHPDLKFGFTNEFMGRADGWPGLRDRYQLPQRDVRGLEHALAYRGLESGVIQAMDLYSTDPEIRFYDLRVLQDDLHYFPNYQAVLLYRADLAERAPAVVQAILQLEGRLSQATIIELNARAHPKEQERVPESRVAADFLAEGAALVEEDSLLHYTGQHLQLVAISLAAAILVAVPLGIVAARRPALGQVILGVVGLIQTIPSLALLVFLIPLLGRFGVGTPPAIVALFLYSLLPIVRNTYAGLHDIPVQIRESAEALGLSAAARLRLVELPMAARSILAGIKTSAVINVGTATLGGIIGAGGYGQLIMKGIRLDNRAILLEGAIPAALLALVVQGLFELAERGLVPRGLRLKPEGAR